MAFKNSIFKSFYSNYLEFLCFICYNRKYLIDIESDIKRIHVAIETGLIKVLTSRNGYNTTLYAMSTFHVLMITISYKCLYESGSNRNNWWQFRYCNNHFDFVSCLFQQFYDVFVLIQYCILLYYNDLVELRILVEMNDQKMDFYQKSQRQVFVFIDGNVVIINIAKKKDRLKV